MDIFEIKDKYGKKVKLPRERWNHITSEHPQLVNVLEVMIDTILNPTFLKQSPHDRNVKYYYKKIKEKRRYLMVAVKYLNGEGYVITSFYTRKILQ